MAFDPPSSSDSQAYDSAQDADRVELVAGGGGAVGTVDQGAGGVSAWLVNVNGVPHVVIDSATIAALTDGTQRVGGTVAVTGALTDAQLRAAAVPISGAVSVSNLPATQPVSGTVTATGPLTDTQLRATPIHVAVDSATIAALTDGTQRVGGTVLVDGSGVTQPVSGTFFQATQPISAALLPLPAGAATDATLDQVRVAVREAAFDAQLRFDETRWA